MKSELIKKAAALPKGSPERREILASLKGAGIGYGGGIQAIPGTKDGEEYVIKIPGTRIKITPIRAGNEELLEEGTRIPTKSPLHVLISINQQRPLLVSIEDFDLFVRHIHFASKFVHQQQP